MDNYQPRHARKASERLHTIIRFTIWFSIVIVSILLVDMIGREVIMELPW